MYIELDQDPDFLALLQQFREGIDVAAVGATVGTDLNLLLRQMRSAFQNPETAPPPWIAAALPPLP
ncbi:hypothetical protein [Streptomyces sp. NPDC101455]|uniref:hypothetical protein n=1 Tax=Streptomyces sp. NPDC101455 TaxID=3366142 RepID=UPI00381FF957